MPKPMYVWSGSAWVSVASEVESLATYATQSYADNQPGMKLIVPSSVAVGSGTGSVSSTGTVSFSGASSVSLNTCFSSTYKFYKIIIDLTGVSADATPTLKLRTGTTDSSAGYYQQLGRMPSSGTGTSLNLANSSNGWDLYSVDGGNNSHSYFWEMTIINPLIVDRTLYSVIGHAVNSTGDFQSIYGAGLHTPTTAYDGCTFLVSAGNATGTISVYGYKN